MGVFDPRQGQVLPSPVTNFYKGKAIRQELADAEQMAELRGLQIEALEQEIEDAPGEKARALEMYELDRQKAVIDVQKGIEDLGFNRMKRRADALRPVVSEAEKLFKAGKIEEAQKLMSEGVPAALTDVEPKAAAQYAEMAGPDKIWQPEEMMRLKNRVEAFGEIEQEAGALTSHQKHLGELRDAGYISDEEYNKIMLDIEKKAGTITGTTEHDPSVSGVNKSGLSRNVIGFQDATIGAVGAVQTGTELMKLSVSNPESLGVPGSFMRFGSNLVAGAQSIADWAGYEPPPSDKTEKQNIGSSAFDYGKIDLDKLNVSGAEAEKFRAGVYGIAFAAAVAEQGTRPTDKDIQQFIDQIGGRATSPDAFRETIFQFMRRQDRRLETIANVKQIPEADRKAALSEWKSSYRGFVESYATSTNKDLAVNPETGEMVIKINGKWEPI